MADFNTFETPSSLVDNTIKFKDPLLSKQHEDVQKMRTSLLACSDGSILSARQAISNVTVLRVYHQISRIVKYLDLMDRLEEKLYDCIDTAIDRADPSNPTSWMMLLNIQERLQKNLIDSHKLLEPYLSVDLQDLYQVIEQPAIDSTANETLALDRPTRDKLRNSAQQVIEELGMSNIGDANID